MPSSDSSISPRPLSEEQMLKALRSAEDTLEVMPPDLANLMEKLHELPQQTPQQTPPSPPPGTRLRYVGDYELLEELGRGGMGVVFKARQISLQRLVAIKMILAGQLASPDAVSRFRREAEAAGNLDHPHLVPVYEVGDYEGQHYYSMKLVEGRSLAELRKEWTVIRRDDPVKPPLAELRSRERRVAKLVEQVALAVHHAHQHGVLHRDLKPANILIDSVGQGHITDFGLAKQLDSQASMTATGLLVGTPSYMAPEQASGSKDITTAVDVYGLGAILYELLSGRPPFEGDSSARVLQRVIDTDPVSPLSADSRLSRDLETICLKCLRKDPRERYASAAALADDLGRFLRDEPILARPISAVERLRKWARRKPASAALTTVSILALMGLVVGLAISNALISKARNDTTKALGEKTEALDREEDASYIKTIALAQQDVLDKDIRHALKLLEGCDPARRDWEWYYLMRKCQATYHHLQSVGPDLRDLAVSPDGKWLAALTNNEDQTRAILEVWNAQTREKVQTLVDPTASAFLPEQWTWMPQLVFSDDSQHVAYTAFEESAGKTTGVVRRFNTKNWQLVPVKPAGFPDRYSIGVMFTKDARCLTITKPVERIAVRDGTVPMHTYDLDSGELLYEFESSQRMAQPVLSPDGKHFMIHVGHVEVCDLATGKLLWYVHPHRATQAVAWHPDGRSVVMADLRGRLTHSSRPPENVLEGTQEFQVAAHRRYAQDVAFLPGGNRLTSVGADGFVKLWNTADGGLVDSLLVGGPLCAVAVLPNGNEIAFADHRGEIGIWSLASQQPLRPPPTGLGQITSFFQGLQASRDGRWCVGCMDLDSYILWDLETGREVHHQQITERIPDQDALDPTAFAFHPSGSYLAAGLGDYDNTSRPGHMRIWEAATGEVLHTFPDDSSSQMRVAWSDDGKTLAWATYDKEIQAWSWPERKRLWSRRVPHVVSGLESRPNSQELAIGQINNTVEFVDIRTGDVMRTLESPVEQLHSMSFALDGSELALGGLVDKKGTRCRIAIVEAPSGKVLQQLTGGESAVVRMQFSPNRRRLFASYFDGNLLLWDRDTGNEIVSLRENDMDLSEFVVTPQGRLVGGQFQGGTVHMLDGRPLER